MACWIIIIIIIFLKMIMLLFLESLVVYHLIITECE